MYQCQECAPFKVPLTLTGSLALLLLKPLLVEPSAFSLAKSSQLLPQCGSGLVKGCTAQPTQALTSRNSTLVTVTGLSLLESS